MMPKSSFLSILMSLMISIPVVGQIPISEERIEERLMENIIAEINSAFIKKYSTRVDTIRIIKANQKGFSAQLGFYKVQAIISKKLSDDAFYMYLEATKNDSLFVYLVDSSYDIRKQEFLNRIGYSVTSDFEVLIKFIGIESLSTNIFPGFYEMLVAVDKSNGKIYELKGFRNNDFKQFYFDLLNERIRLLSPDLQTEFDKNRINHKKLLSKLYVANLDIIQLYECQFKVPVKKRNKKRCACLISPVKMHQVGD